METDMTSQHLDPVTIARIVDAGHGSASPEELRHLSGCRSCLEAFHDVAMLRGLDLSESPAVQGETAAQRATVHATPFFRRPWAGAAAATALVALVFVIVVGLGGSTVPNVPETVLTRLVEQSETGFVVPEAAAQIHTPSIPVRSGGGDPINTLAESGDRNDIRLRLLTMAAADHVDEARSLLGSLPSDQRNRTWARHLDAVLAYRSSRLDLAELRLRALIGDDPHDGPALFNLALLLSETNRHDEARELLARVDAISDSVLDFRADALAQRLR